MSQRAAADSSLARSIGAFALGASIFNITIGGGIFKVPADVAADLGATAPWAYVICAVAMGLIVMCMAEAGSRVSLTGGPYAYVETAFGPFAGFLAGFLLWLLLTMAMAAVATVLVANLGGLVPALSSRTAGALTLAVIYVVFAAINILGVERGSRVNTAIAILKILPLVLLIVLGLSAVEPSNLTSTNAPDMGTLARGSIMLIFVFAGIEAALVPGGEVRDPARTVPRAILGAMITVTLLYAGLQFVAQGILGSALATERSAPLAAAAGVAMGEWSRQLLLIGAVISTLGHVGAMTLAVPRTLYAFARDGFLPRVLARTHPVYRTPAVAIVLQCAIVLVLAITSSFMELAILANISTLVLYAMCCVAAWQLRRRDVRAGGTPFRVPVPALVIPVALAMIAWMLTSVERDEWLALGKALAVATAIYLLRRPPSTAPA